MFVNGETEITLNNQTDNQFTTAKKRATETDNNISIGINRTSEIQNVNTIKSKLTSYNRSIARINSYPFLVPVKNSVILDY